MTGTKLESLWLEYQSAIKALLQAKVSNADDVEDLLQEILIKAYRGIHTLKSSTSLKPWLFQIANHTVIDYYRKKGRPQPVIAEELWFTEDDIDAQQALSNCIEPFVKALPSDSAELLTAIDLQGQSQKDYAQALGISYSTLKSRVQKGRRQLRGLFEDCCHLTLDAKGNVIDFYPKSNRCKNC